MGMTVKCTKCQGTGNMGLTSSVRCRLCSGKGHLELKDVADALLYEWLEGYHDEETEDAWLEEQLKKLLKARKERNAHH